MTPIAGVTPAAELAVNPLTKARWDAARRVLCVRLDALGDLLMTTPALAAVKHHRPEMQLLLLTSDSGAALAPYLPLVDKTVMYRAPWMKATPPKPSAAEDQAFIEQLRTLRCDAMIIFNVFSQSPLPAALYGYLAGIPLRAAFCHESPYQLLTDWIPDPEPGTFIRHEVARHLALVEALGYLPRDERLTVAVDPAARSAVRRRLRSVPRPFLVLHPGASAPSRRYPADKFGHVIRALHAKGLTAVLTGSADERALVRDVASAAGCALHDFSGELSLSELIALIAEAPLLLTNNTGPAHIAAAVGTPVVDLYALTNPQHTPWRVPSRVLFHEVPCRNCFKSICPLEHHACLTRVSEESVTAACLELLQEQSPDGDAEQRPAVNSPAALRRPNQENALCGP